MVLLNIPCVCMMSIDTVNHQLVSGSVVQFYLTYELISTPCTYNCTSNTLPMVPNILQYVFYSSSNTLCAVKLVCEVLFTIITDRRHKVCALPCFI